MSASVFIHHLYLLFNREMQCHNMNQQIEPHYFVESELKGYQVVVTRMKPTIDLTET